MIHILLQITEPDVIVDQAMLQKACEDWIEKGGPLLLAGPIKATVFGLTESRGGFCIERSAGMCFERYDAPTYQALYDMVPDDIRKELTAPCVVVS